MSAYRPPLLRPVRPAVAALLAALSLLAAAPRAAAEESPVGKLVADVVPVNNRIRPTQHILGKMLTRPGKPYDEAIARDDVARLMKSNWFAPNGVELKTSLTQDGKVVVFVHVQELKSVVHRISFLGNKHYSESELHDALALSQVRQGAAMNPANNRYAAAQIAQKLKEDGRHYAAVSLLKGDRPGDEEVVFNIVEGPVVRVGRVDFRGNEIASDDRLRTVVNTKGALFGTPTILTDRFVPAKLNEDIQQLLLYYRRLGYLDAQVATSDEPMGADMAAVKVTFHIREGRPYTVRSVKMDGNVTLAEARLRKGVGLEVGKPYDESVVQADLKRLTTMHGYEGLQVGVEPGVFLVPGQPGVVDVHYKVTEPERVANQGAGAAVGPRGPDRLGEIEIVGNTITQKRVILNQLTGLNPGQILEYPRVEEARQNLIRLQIFDNDPPPVIEVLPPKNPDSPFRDIRVTVRETRTGMVGLQVGVNSNAGLSGTATLNQRNFDITRVPTSFDDLLGGKAFRGGGQEFRLTAMPGTTIQRYEATWREPFLFDQPYGLTNSMYYGGRQFFEYSENRYGNRVTVDRRLDEYGVWHANFSSRAEGLELYNIPEYAPQSITRDQGSKFLLGLRGGITRDTRDSFLMPNTGSVLEMNVEQVLGSNTFPIGTIEGTKFWTLHQARDGGWKGVLALRSQLTVMADGAPVYERVFGGGFRSLRGFSFRGVGPYEAAGPGQPVVNTGGRFAFLNTAEYQIPLMASERVRFVTFVDHGTIESSVAIRDYRVSVGVGLRIQIPAFGPLPIALDFAWPIRKGPFDNEQIFSFYVGWIGGQ